MVHDPYNLQRFVDARDSDCRQAYSELRSGRQRGEAPGSAAHFQAVLDKYYGGVADPVTQDLLSRG